MSDATNDVTDVPQSAVVEGAEMMSDDEIRASMADLVQESISDPGTNEFRGRIREKKIHDLAGILTRREAAAKRESEKAQLARMRLGKSPLPSYGEAEQEVVLRREAAEEMARLVELGFTEDEIPDDLQPWQVKGLRMQRLLAEKDFTALASLMEQELAIIATPESRSTFRRFAQADFDPDLKISLANLLLEWTFAAHSERADAQRADLDARLADLDDDDA